MDKISFSLLYSKYLAGTCTPEELESFHSYMLLPEGEKALRELLQETYAGIRNHSATLVDASGNLVPAPGTPAMPRLLHKKRLQRRLKISLMAGFALLAAVSVWIVRENEETPYIPEPPTVKTTVTAPAEYKRIVLPDSSVVWLNADSRLGFPEHFGPGVREVTLSGEASFDIKHAAEHPFLIHTGRIVTRVLGTAFNVNAYPDRHSVTVSVSRGRVQVIRDQDTLATLVKGQQVKVNSEDSSRPVRKTITAASVADWQNGNLDYDDQTLAEVVADLGRVFDTEIRIENPKLRGVRINTRFRRDQGLAPALEILEKLTDSHIVFTNKMYLIQ